MGIGVDAGISGSNRAFKHRECAPNAKPIIGTDQKLTTSIKSEKPNRLYLLGRWDTIFSSLRPSDSLKPGADPIAPKDIVLC